MGDKKLITVELVFATQDKQRLLSIEVALGTMARDAVMNSRLKDEFPETDFSQCPLGIWGRPVAGEHRLHEGDRVEAYRPLRRDPRDARRELALKGLSIDQRLPGSKVGA